MDYSIREPKQKRAILKKEKIIEAGFELICKNGYYNTNTAEIAKIANVSTGIVYQYFGDKHDILMAALEKYGDKIFFPMVDISTAFFSCKKLDDCLKQMIEYYIKNHRLSKIAHEEIMSMIHSDKDVAKYYYKIEMNMTNYIKDNITKYNIKNGYLDEKVHIMIGMIDNLCHEIIYHKHENMNYEIMTNMVINNILFLFKKDLK